MAEANLRYYEAVGRLSIDYVRAVAGAVGSLGGPPQGRPPAAPVHARDRPSAAGASAPALVLEAEAGGSAVGAFMVENLLGEEISAPVAASAFVSPEGHEVRPRLSFDPEVVVLGPGEQVLVRAVAAFDDALEAGVGYRGEVTVPGLGGRGLSIVLRRRVSEETPPPRAPRVRGRSSPATRRKGGDGPRRAR